VGKSTLINKLIGEKITITSPIAQTTRNKLKGILTTDNGQIIFVDTPGVHKPHHRLGEILVKNAKLKVREREIKNLYFLFGNAHNILNNVQSKFIFKNVKSISFYFPDPWFKKKHYKRRVIQPEFINMLSNSLQKGTIIFIKTDVMELFNYMDCTISNNFHFKTIDKKDFNYSESFNPIKFKTDREKYVIVNQLDIYEKIYIKI